MITSLIWLEAALSRTFDQVMVLPNNGAGSIWFDHIKFGNEDCEYPVLYPYERFHKNGDVRDRDETLCVGLITISLVRRLWGVRRL